MNLNKFINYLSFHLFFLDNYVRDIKTKTCEVSAIPSILNETSASTWVDGNNALGPIVGNFCMDLAIRKAKQCGVGWVVAKGTVGL